ncbi:C1GLT-like protein [Mya arenaria]|uniref:N-acetylgalactosaminide beta-1,3-galactosyltransferase n=2 Tax=Mya arenaria TaxID=6604 RepID=A0ABY7DCM8_MYAAR|nr:glycoprotein-N-acetylgalactosamine 3-beta-galactosyltransferase 1-like isoform X2 [Mya arenaria]XP_052796556.1 glycoprotein-N-acetylgalactosamine 3-beta-galactosyltransferase 1-like isoform X2 [Mya arenaria]XP_052796564.1 glycoprotein-N-acetylgalactosamine 3-beta-galactosyltransferase 1-like isoform X2 [Mya arenaria]XP_052796574.1 glycoprotein-N-acetylgalactosamine 3-beta-galactosyltransferase 1-like isoform X2 [Mya arenaria]XP_052796582.1 glycoprotein-N-acetylgalactosamine 3-beta-galactosyl
MQIGTFNFVLGLSVGLVFAYMGITYTTRPEQRGLSAGVMHMAIWEDEPRVEVPRDSFLTQEDLDKIQKTIRPVQFQDAHSHHYDNREAQKLYDKVRVLCWVMTSPKNLQKKAVHVRATWAQRCNKIIFISSVANDSFPTVGIDVPEGREHLTGKTMKAFQYVFDHHFDDADWFIKTDDDTYTILENLRYFLSDQNKDSPIYFGHHFKVSVKQGYLSGGAGYIISKEALRRFGAHGTNASMCRQDGGYEDAEFGNCMQNLGVKVGNSTDRFGRSRFHCFDPATHLMGDYPRWYHLFDAHGGHSGRESISDYAISFHYVPPARMYELEYLTYHLRPYGINSGNQDLNQKVT